MDANKMQKTVMIGAACGATAFYLLHLATGIVPGGAIAGGLGGLIGGVVTGIVVLFIDSMQRKAYLRQFQHAEQVWEETEHGGDRGATRPSTNPALTNLIKKILHQTKSAMLTSYGSYRFFTDGRFMEFADNLPPVIEKTFSVVKSPVISPDAIDKSIPTNVVKEGHPVQGIEKKNGRYVLSASGTMVLVDAIYFDYIRYRYPDATILLLDESQPVVFMMQEIIRAVLMPIDPKHDSSHDG